MVSLVTDIHQFIPNSIVVDAYKTMIFSLHTMDGHSGRRRYSFKGLVRKEGVVFIGSYVHGTS